MRRSMPPARLHNLTLETLRVALSTSLADDDPVEFCYWTMGYYTRRSLLRPSDIFILDLSSGHRKFFPCYTTFGLPNIFNQALPSGQQDYASRMPASDTLKRTWYTKMQHRLLGTLGYHFTIFVDIDEWLVPRSPYFETLQHYFLNLSRTPLRHAVTAPLGCVVL
ncbi:hypothetical protein AB1Y20_008397 [Prymnesium parvum]|uniref:Glycosyltransferase family 92 protein n=1 Tax=Prymnesium parvum TaxID=97485 RepID=A0AB34ITF6_PRYPA